ncbi:hypothetical protein, partial [Klebsiella pneumoniae]|uniref:hypothetical protein n=1 Tax=Klebsiella pneumoniae TaxID=573 RepID=UPI003F66CBF5
GGKNSLNRLIRCVCGKKIGPDPRNFNQRVSLGRNDLLIRTFPSLLRQQYLAGNGTEHENWWVSAPASFVTGALSLSPLHCHHPSTY